MAERIVVIGHSAVTCLGRSMRETWDGLIQGRSGLNRHEGLAPDVFLQDIAGVVEGLGPGKPDADSRLSRLDARFLHLALEAAQQAWGEAGLEARREFDRSRVAIAVGSAFGGVDLLEAENKASSKRNSLATGPYLVPGMIINQAAGQIA